jgi:hypothetical protein
MPHAGQLLSAVIPSRWSFEANLLHEATASEWGANKPMPDYTCNIQPPQAPPGSQPMPSESPMPSTASMSSASSMPSAASMPPGASTPPGAPIPPGALDPDDLNPSLHIQGDPAEGSIPAYLITFTDAGGVKHTCRASANEQYPHYGPTAHAVANRHSFRDSMGVLAAMVLALIAGIIAILRKRDNDPQ